MDEKQKKIKISKKARDCVLAMSQADKPTAAEFLAAWEAGLLDVTPRGQQVILDATTKSNQR
jgi:hypothetical protein